MSVLAIETSTDQLGVALVTDDRVVASYELLAERPHAVELPQAVTRVLEAGHESLEHLEAIIVDIGPGSFTGLRIGIAFVKALVFRRATPVVGVPSLDVLAANVRYAPHSVCPILDAKQKKVYAAVYQVQDGHLLKQSDYSLLPIEDVFVLVPGPTIFVGDGVARYGDRLKAQLQERAVFAPPDLWWPSAATLGRLGLERFRQGLKDDPSTLVPMYLHPHDCTIQKP